MMKIYEDINKEVSDKQTKLFNDNKAFFAFSDSQLDEAMKEHNIVNKADLVNLSCGLIAPRVNAKTIMLGLAKIQAEKKQAIKDRADIKKVILYELNNYECFYTGDIEDALRALSALGVTRDQVLEVYKTARSSNETHRDNL